MKKVSFWTLLLIFFGAQLLPLGCAPQKASSHPGGAAASGNPLMDQGDSVFDVPSDSNSKPPKANPKVRPPVGEWAIALTVISGDEHQATAKAMREKITTTFPELQGTFVDNASAGSAVFFGSFKSPTSESFRSAMVRIKAMKLPSGRPAFPKALPAKPKSRVRQSSSPFDLRKLREQLGARHPVYTLQIAQWGTFGDTSTSFERCRSQAEAFTSSLRQQGFMAYFSHNSGREISSVNVGVFGDEAYDPRSTLFSPEVEAMFQHFPRLRVNGADLIDPRTRQPRKPFLVEVPR